MKDEKKTYLILSTLSVLLIGLLVCAVCVIVRLQSVSVRMNELACNAQRHSITSERALQEVSDSKIVSDDGKTVSFVKDGIVDKRDLETDSYGNKYTVNSKTGDYVLFNRSYKDNKETPTPWGNQGKLHIGENISDR